MKFPAFSLALFSALIVSATAQESVTSSSGSLARGGLAPGVLSVSGDDAIPIVTGGNGSPAGAAAPLGQGRVVGFSHGGFLKGTQIPSQPDGATLLKDVAKWVSGGKLDARIGLHKSVASLTSVFPDAEVQEPGRARCDVYFVLAQKSFPEADIQSLRKHVERGGGLVVSATPWAFSKDYPDFADFPANQLLAGSGISMKSSGTTGGPMLSILSTDIELINNALTQLEEKGPRHTPSELTELFSVLAGASQLRGASLDDFLKRLEAINRKYGPIIPTKENPVIQASDPFKMGMIKLETSLNLGLPAGKMYAIPASEDYPGAVPINAPRTTLSPTIDGQHRGWLSGRGAGGWNAGEMRPTGLYAAPGEVITVTVPPEVVGKNFEVVIGSYNGGLDNRDKWSRYPKLMRSFPILKTETRASNGLGGLVTIRVPSGAAVAPFKVSIDGAVRAPIYVHGKTSVDTWRNDFRKFPAPWAELVSDRMIIAIPSAEIRRLNDPDKVMEWWNEIINASADLVAVDRENYRAERIVFDRLTAAGSMHSGYPVAAHIGSASAKAVDSKKLRDEGDWGFFHEYGHNHQHNLWALPGTGETTCNLWSVYLFEEVIGKNRNDTHRAIRPLDRKQRMNKYFADGRKFNQEWSMWVALEAYLQIQEEFGWEPFTKLFEEYNNLSKEQWPSGQQQINDQFVIRMSKACEKDLSDFWKAWNLPLSPSVPNELSHLSDWKEHPVAKLVGN